MDCPSFEKNIEDYLEDRLDSTERREFKEHLRTCARCRDEALSIDPSFLVSTLSPGAVDGQRVERCASAVTAMIRQERLQRRMGGFGVRRAMAAAAAVIIVLAGGLLWHSQQQEGPTVVAESEAPSAENVPPPRVEIEMPSSDVTVYQFAGTNSESTAVYFVVNQEMEL